eukprot:GDKH01005252.1.p1 GENE.GDKH01005252.1~~GDKH01005252.1.p1  ORF type:complete len:70 (-),score=4.71 GDKH01005252.1:40-249(-)
MTDSIYDASPRAPCSAEDSPHTVGLHALEARRSTGWGAVVKPQESLQWSCRVAADRRPSTMPTTCTEGG